MAIARGQEPPAEVGALSLGEYAGRMSAPHRMDLMLSAMPRAGRWHSNQKCLHCYAAGQTLGETPELTTDQWRELLEKLRRANIPQVTFTGGEPTLRPDLPELVEAAQWFVTQLNTNGRLLTPELCRRLFEASLDSVQVTLYAADAAVHNALVGAEGFDDTVQGIRNAAAAGLIVSVNTPLCSLNRDYAETLRFVHGLGVRYVTCSGLIPTGSAAGEESLEKIRDNDVRAEALRDQVSQLDAAAQEETSAMAVLENSLSHDKQTLERLDRELADTQQRAGNLRAQADALTDRIDQIDAETQDLARQLEELMDALRQLAESAGSA